MYGFYYCPDTIWATYWASDMITCRWLQTNEALGHYQTMLAKFGFSTEPVNIWSTHIQGGMIGQPIGRAPWDLYGQRDVTALAVWELQFAYGDIPASPAWAHLGATESAVHPAGAATAVEAEPLTGVEPPEPDQKARPPDATD